jgi:DNA-binding NarL/FixJ family response regulator
MAKLRILIADDHDIVRRGLRVLIESQDGWEVCGEATNGREAVEMAGKLEPDVVVLDVAMPEIEGVEATRQIKRQRADTEVLACTGFENESVVHQLFAAGARACVLKTDVIGQLIPGIEALSRHQPYLVSSISRMVFEQYLRGGMPAGNGAPGGLTPRERETIQLLAEGKSNKEVATALGVSVKTVESHRAAIMRKLDFTSFSELVRYAVRNHLVEP